MELKLSSLKDITCVKTPKYNVEEVIKNTKENPIWLHFGAGNIFRGYIARLQDDLLNHGLCDKGIIAAETFDFEIIDQIYDAYDNLTMLATLSATKPVDYRIVASVVEGVKASKVERLKEIIVNPSLQFISFTITEKGYGLRGLDGEYLGIVKEDIKNGPASAKHAMSVVCALLHERYLNGKLPLAVVSMDNCSHNGEKLQNSILTIANEWKALGYVEEEFISYLTDEAYITFPWSMIDKITPRPAESVEKEIEKLGFTNMSPITTSKRTFIAPFVNAEVCEYLVIEDKFPNGRPSLEKAGVYLTSREIVNKVETMKVTTCLNPLHTALAVYGCVLGFDSIASEMSCPELKKLVYGIGEEGMKVVVNPGIIAPEQFLSEVLNERLPNKAIPDTPQRIATDTSQKIVVRFGETIKSYLKDENLDVNGLIYIPLALAGWCRYLIGLNDNLEQFELSADPMLEVLKAELKDVEIGKDNSIHLKNVLSNERVFGINLYTTVLGEKVEGLFNELTAGKGAVIATLKKYVK